MIERHITLTDVEEAYLNGEMIRIVMAYLKESKTLVITVIGDIYEN